MMSKDTLLCCPKLDVGKRDTALHSEKTHSLIVVFFILKIIM
jgi:hypothetical protein